MKKYRKIWSDHYGPIPKDHQGRSYEIHHIDGDKTNNDITNLKAVSIEEHYTIHKNKGDWIACLIISNRLTLSSQELNEIYEKLKQRVVCPHCGKEGGICAMKRWHFDKCFTLTNKKFKHEIVYCPHCGKAGGTNNMSKYHFDNCTQYTKKPRPKTEIVKCPHCHKEGGKNVMKQYHFNNCKTLTGKPSVKRKIITCPHCNVKGESRCMKRWHFNNCKLIK